MKTYQVNKEGYYGEFGGAYIPEILHRCVEELQNAYSKVLESEGFKQEFHQLLTYFSGYFTAYFFCFMFCMMSQVFCIFL